MSIFNTFVEPFSNHDTIELARDQKVATSDFLG